MDPFVKSIIAGQLRHLLTVAAGSLVTVGALSGDQSSQFVTIASGIILWLIGAGWSYLQKHHISDLLKKAPTLVKMLLLCFLVGATLHQARAADVTTPATDATATAALSGFGVGTPCATTTCTGLYAGFNLAGIATNANVLGAGINGSLAAGGQNIGIQAGYQYWNGTFFFGPEVFGDYTFGGSPIVAGYSAPKYLFGEVVKVGGPLASFFGGIAPASTTGVSAVLLSKTISPYIMIGAAERPWGTGILYGAGITFDIDDHWFVDSRYMNIQYTGSNQASPVQTVPQENIILVGVNYKF